MKGKISANAENTILNCAQCINMFKPFLMMNRETVMMMSERHNYVTLPEEIFLLNNIIEYIDIKREPQANDLKVYHRKIARVTSVYISVLYTPVFLEISTEAASV